MEWTQQYVTLPSYRIFTLTLGFPVGLLFGYTTGMDIV